MLKANTWTNQKPHVMSCCDGYEAALAAMMEKESE
jgi:hypothetical protein